MAQKATLETINIDKYVKVDEGQGFQNYITPLDENNMNNIEQGIVNLNNLGTGVDNVLNRNFTALNNAIGDINEVPDAETLAGEAGRALIVTASGEVDVTSDPLSTVATSGSYNDLTNKLTAGTNISISGSNVISAYLDATYNNSIINDNINVSTNVSIEVVSYGGTACNLYTIRLNKDNLQAPGNNILDLTLSSAISLGEYDQIKIICGNSTSTGYTDLMKWWNPVTGQEEVFYSPVTGSFNHLVVFVSAMDPLDTIYIYPYTCLISGISFNTSSWNKYRLNGYTIQRVTANEMRTSSAGNVYCNLMTNQSEQVLTTNSGGSKLVEITPYSEAFTWDAGCYIQLGQLPNLKIPVVFSSACGPTNKWPGIPYTYNSSHSILIYLSDWRNGQYNRADWIAPTTLAEYPYNGEWAPEFPNALGTVEVTEAKYSRSGNLVTVTLFAQSNQNIGNAIGGLPYNIENTVSSMGTALIEINWASSAFANVQSTNNLPGTSINIIPIGYSANTPLSKITFTLTYITSEI